MPGFARSWPRDGRDKDGTTRFQGLEIIFFAYVAVRVFFEQLTIKKRRDHQVHAAGDDDTTGLTPVVAIVMFDQIILFTLIFTVNGKPAAAVSPAAAPNAQMRHQFQRQVLLHRRQQ